MNDANRKTWRAAQMKLEEAKSALEELLQLQEEEQERYDNLPEGLQAACDNDGNGQEVRDCDVQGAIDAIEDLCNVEP
jgi:hypothetical protein